MANRWREREATGWQRREPTSGQRFSDSRALATGAEHRREQKVGAAENIDADRYASDLARGCRSVLTFGRFLELHLAALLACGLAITWLLPAFDVGAVAVDRRHADRARRGGDADGGAESAGSSAVEAARAA